MKQEPPKRVLVIGGGDGGVVREITRYSSVEHIDVAEIDKMVVDVAKQYFPSMSCSFDDPRVHVHYCDGCEFVKNAAEGSYDAIIIDSSDPVGPALVLYETPFYESVHRALKPGGAVCSMSECMWLHMSFIEDVTKRWKSVFANGSASYGYVCTPSYPCGQIGLLVCMKCDPNQESVSPLKPYKLYFQEGSDQKSAPLKYYNEKIHSAAFSLPQFAMDALGGILTFQ